MNSAIQVSPVILGSMNGVIQASPVIIGGIQANIEIKRITSKVGSGISRFPPKKWAGRNDNFRVMETLVEVEGKVKMTLLEDVAEIKDDEVVTINNKEEGEADGEVA